MPVDALRLLSVNAGYGESHILHDVSFTVAEGQALCLLGRNGAGKTTAMHAVAGLQPIRSGTIELFGQSLSDCAPEDISRRGLALVPQGRRIFKSLSVQENLEVARSRTPPRFGQDVLFDWFPRLKERRHQSAGALSGGEQQMLAIARALMTNPRVILFDEPSEGLAPQIVEEISVMLHRLKAAGITIVLVEHNTRLALSIADTVAILNAGRIVFSGTSEAASSDSALLSSHLGLH